MGASPGIETDKLVAWAASNPRIRRLWLFDDAAKRNARAAKDLVVAIELEPVADSEETIAYWIAHAEEWQPQLEECAGRSVDLDWFDPDVDAPLGDKAYVAYDRLNPVTPQRPSSSSGPPPPR